MKIHRFYIFFCMAMATLACSLLNVTPSWAQKGGPPGNPQAPTINPLSPSGVQRGQPLDLIVTGTNLAQPTGISLGIPAKTTIPTEDKNGQDATKFKVRIEVPADAPIGWYPFRLATLKGISNLRVFCVDDLAPVPRQHGQSQQERPRPGDPGAVRRSPALRSPWKQGDVYKFSVKAGQRLSFDCLARRLGSPIDAQMTVYDAKSMRELAYDNDSPGCQTDPRISYTFKEAGDYLIEIKDVLNRGGADFFYRLRIGDFPLATTPVPMAAKRGSKAKVGFAGPAVAGVAAVDVEVPSDPTVTVVWVAPKSAAGLHGWPVPLAVSDMDEIVEQEPNNDAKTATRFTVPGGITGRFQQRDDVDFFVFSAKKGQKLAIEAQTLELYSPTLAYLILKNAKTGAEIAKSNPQTPPPADQRIDFTAADDGDYLLEVQHLHFASGPSESYRITVRPPPSGFDLTLPNERFDVAPNGVAAIPVQVVRKGYTGPIELTAQGAAGFTGTATIKAGANAGLVLVAAKGDVPMGAYQFKIVGKATVDGQPVIQVASAKAAVVASLEWPPLSADALAALHRHCRQRESPVQPGDQDGSARRRARRQGERHHHGDARRRLRGRDHAEPADRFAGNDPPAEDGCRDWQGEDRNVLPARSERQDADGGVFPSGQRQDKIPGEGVDRRRPAAAAGAGIAVRSQSGAGDDQLESGRKDEAESHGDAQGGLQGPDHARCPQAPRQRDRRQSDDRRRSDDGGNRDQRGRQRGPHRDRDGVDVAGTATALNNLQNASAGFTVRVQKK